MTLSTYHHNNRSWRWAPVRLASWFGVGFHIILNLQQFYFTIHEYLYVDALQEWLNQVKKWLTILHHSICRWSYQYIKWFNIFNINNLTSQHNNLASCGRTMPPNNWNCTMIRLIDIEFFPILLFSFIYCMIIWQNTVESGYMQALFGKDSLQDFLHIDNLVQAHILAGRALMESNRSVAVSNTSLYKLMVWTHRFSIGYCIWSLFYAST